VEFKGEDAATVEPRLGDIVQKTADQTEQTLRPLAPKSGSRTIAGVPIVFIGDIKGAPGDGNSSLAIGLRTALPQRGISVKETSADAGWRIECAVNVTSKSKTEDTVTLKWRVLDKSGVEKGSMTQENAVPRGRLDKEWGEIAGFATEAASEGIQSIIQQVAKPPTE
jgi:hypothetical protein